MKFFSVYLYTNIQKKIKELDEYPELNKQSNMTNDQVKKDWLLSLSLS